jgi:hypothetical protein
MQQGLTEQTTWNAWSKTSMAALSGCNLVISLRAYHDNESTTDVIKSSELAIMLAYTRKSLPIGQSRFLNVLSTIKDCPSKPSDPRGLRHLR